MRWPRSALVFGLVGLASACLGADRADRLTVGRIVTLITEQDGKHRSAILSQALKSPNADLRAAAARVALVTASRESVGALRAALSTETARPAAIEQLQALAALDLNRSLELLVRACRRLGGGLPTLLASELARTEGPRALDRVPLLLELDAVSHEFLTRAVGGNGALLMAPARLALSRKSEKLWGAVLPAAEKLGYSLPEDLLVDSVAMPGLRAATLSSLLKRISRQDAPSPAMIKALRAVTGEVGSQPSMAAFCLELTDRMKGQPAHDYSQWLASADWKELLPVSSLARPLTDARVLTEEERRALGRRLFEDETRFLNVEAPQPERAADAAPVRLVRRASHHPAGYVRATLDETGCRPAGTLSAAARIFRDDTGRVRDLQWLDGTSMEPSCQTAADVLLRSDLMEIFSAPAGEEYSVLVIDADDAACAAGGQDSAADASHPPTNTRAVPFQGKIREPRKLRNVPPKYPRAAARARISGRVVLEATISPAGCVSGVVVKEPVDVALDVEAVRAVSQWRYTPTELGGKPVPVIMAVTVNFTL